VKLAPSLLFLAVLAAAQDTATVEGVVVNKVTGAGVGGATVRFLAPKADRYETVADETGVFRITGVKPGDYSASVEKERVLFRRYRVVRPFSRWTAEIPR